VVEMELRESGIGSVKWKVERGKEVVIPKVTASQIVNTAREFAALQFRMQKLEMEMDQIAQEAEPLREAIIEIARQYPGWRGIVDPDGNLDLTATPRKRWNAEALKEYLGSLYYPLLGRGELELTFILPLVGKEGFIPPEVIVAILEKALLDLGVKLEGVFALPPKEEAFEIKEDQIEELQRKGRLPPMPQEVAKITWAISLRPWKRG
jgi:hypothetical protein